MKSALGVEPELTHNFTRRIADEIHSEDDGVVIVLDRAIAVRIPFPYPTFHVFWGECRELNADLQSHSLPCKPLHHTRHARPCPALARDDWRIL